MQGQEQPLGVYVALGSSFSFPSEVDIGSHLLGKLGWYLRVAVSSMEVDYPSDTSVSVAMVSCGEMIPSLTL